MRRATVSVLAILLLLSPPWMAVLAQGSRDTPAVQTERARAIDEAVNAVSSMYNHALKNDGRGPLSQLLPPGYDRWIEARVQLPDDVAAQLEPCVELLFQAWEAAVMAVGLHEAASQANGDARTRLHREGNQAAAEAMRVRVEARGCIDAAVLEIYMARPSPLHQGGNPAPLLEPVTFVRDQVLPVLKTGVQAALSSLRDRVLPVLKTALQATLDSLLRGWTKGVERAVESVLVNLVKGLTGGGP